MLHFFDEEFIKNIYKKKSEVKIDLVAGHVNHMFEKSLIRKI